MSLAGCSADAAAKKYLNPALDALADALSELIDGDVWDESEPAAGEAEQAEEDEILPGDAAEDSDEGPSELGGELTDEQAMMATTGMIRYSYAQLSDSDRALYRDIYTILINHAEEVIINSLDADQVDRVFQLVMNDHPEIFYVTGYSMNKYTLNGVATSLEFTGTYTKTKDQADDAWPVINTYEAKCFAGLPENADDYDKVRYVYEYLIENTEYNLDAEDNQNILSVFDTGESVCQGYAKATQYLLNELGIPCLIITGIVKGGEPHAWNMACVDGQWTYIDTTWGDASYRNVDTGAIWNEITYDYLCVGEDELKGTHRADNIVDMPEAVRIK